MGKLTPSKYCMQQLDIPEMIEYDCNFSDCRHCGHNKNVAQYRKRLIRTYGLTKCDDGLYRFIIPKRSRGNGGKTA